MSPVRSAAERGDEPIPIADVRALIDVVRRLFRGADDAEVRRRLRLVGEALAVIAETARLLPFTEPGSHRMGWERLGSTCDELRRIGVDEDVESLLATIVGSRSVH